MTNRHEGHIRERSPGSWEIRYSLGADALTGARKTATATVRGTKADAKRELRKRLHSKDEGLHVDPSRLTVKDYIERWLNDSAIHSVSPKTLERYGELLRKHVAARVGHLPVQKLQAVDLIGLYSILVKEGGQGGAPLSPRTVGHVHRVLHTALKAAVVWRIVHANPAASVRAPRVEMNEIEVPSPAAIKSAMENLRGEDIYPISLVALGTGMRRGELLALRWRAVELLRSDGASLQVLESLEQTKKGLRFKVPKTKHGKRTLSLPAFVVDELRAHRQRQLEQRLILGLGKLPEDALVFGDALGNPRRPDGLTKQWANAAKRLRLKATFHVLRHVHASQLIASGLDVLTISRRLGHANASITTNVYGHLFRDGDDRAVKALDAAFSSSAK